MIAILELIIGFLGLIATIYFGFKNISSNLSNQHGIQMIGNVHGNNLNNINIHLSSEKNSHKYYIICVYIILVIISLIFIYLGFSKISIDRSSYFLNKDQYSQELKPNMNIGFYQPGTLNITNNGMRDVIVHGYSIAYEDSAECKKISEKLINSGMYDQIYSEFSRTVWFSEPKRMTKVLYIDLYLENSIGEKYISKHKVKVRFDPLESGQLYKEVEMNNWSNNFCS